MAVCSAPSAQVTALASGLGGAQGGVFGAICVMPLEMVVAKRASGDPRSTLRILGDVIQRDGFFGLWSFRVMPAKCLYAFLNRGLMYGSYAWISGWASRRTAGLSGGLVGAAVIAWFADIAVKPIVHPIETVVIRLNRSESGERAGELVCRMLRDEGVGAFFRGMSTHIGYSWRAGLTEASYEFLRFLAGVCLGVTLEQNCSTSHHLFASLGMAGYCRRLAGGRRAGQCPGVRTRLDGACTRVREL